MTDVTAGFYSLFSSSVLSALIQIHLHNNLTAGRDHLILNFIGLWFSNCLIIYSECRHVSLHSGHSSAFYHNILLQKVLFVDLLTRRNMFVCLFKYEIAIVTEEGVEIVGPLSSETNWDIAHMVR